MKQYEIIASKEVIATFAMDYASFKMKFRSSVKLAAWIIEQHPELKDVPYNCNFPDDTITIEFYSVGNLVINEK